MDSSPTALNRPAAINGETHKHSCVDEDSIDLLGSDSSGRSQEVS